MAKRNKTDRYWVGFDLGGTKMLGGLLDAEFRIVDTERIKTREQDGDGPALERIEKVIGALLERRGLSGADLRGIGIGSPGPLDLQAGVVLDTPNLGWKNVPIRSFLEERFHCPVVLANDVDAGVYGEYRHGAGRKARSVLGVFPGTGIGGGFVYDGHLLHGGRLSCMELGHVCVQPDGPLCGCGRRGCLEAVASRLAIAAEAAKAVSRGQAPHLASLAGTQLSKIRSKALARSVENGDRVVEEILRAAARAIGRAVAGVVNLLAPDVVVLGGGLVEAMPDLFVEECRAAAEAQVMPCFAGTFAVKPAALGDDAGVIGAAALAAEPGALQ